MPIPSGGHHREVTRRNTMKRSVPGAGSQCDGTAELVSCPVADTDRNFVHSSSRGGGQRIDAKVLLGKPLGVAGDGKHWRWSDGEILPILDMSLLSSSRPDPANAGRLPLSLVQLRLRLARPGRGGDGQMDGGESPRRII